MPSQLEGSYSNSLIARSRHAPTANRHTPITLMIRTNVLCIFLLQQQKIDIDLHPRTLFRMPVLFKHLSQ